MLKSVKLKKYCELSGDTRDGFNGKIKKGIYIEGIHYKKMNDGVIWVNLGMIDEWYEIGTQRQIAKHMAIKSA